MRGVAAGVGLGERVAAELLAARERRQEARLLLGRAVALDAAPRQPFCTATATESPGVVRARAPRRPGTASCVEARPRRTPRGSVTPRTPSLGEGAQGLHGHACSLSHSAACGATSRSANSRTRACTSRWASLRSGITRLMLHHGRHGGIGTRAAARRAARRSARPRGRADRAGLGQLRPGAPGAAARERAAARRPGGADRARADARAAGARRGGGRARPLDLAAAPALLRLRGVVGPRDRRAGRRARGLPRRQPGRRLGSGRSRGAADARVARPGLRLPGRHRDLLERRHGVQHDGALGRARARAARLAQHRALGPPLRAVLRRRTRTSRSCARPSCSASGATTCAASPSTRAGASAWTRAPRRSTPIAPRDGPGGGRRERGHDADGRRRPARRAGRRLRGARRLAPRRRRLRAAGRARADEPAPLFAGLDRADSVASTRTSGCSCPRRAASVLVRDRTWLERAFTHDEAYMPHERGEPTRSTARSSTRGRSARSSSGSPSACTGGARFARRSSATSRRRSCCRARPRATRARAAAASRSSRRCRSATSRPAGRSTSTTPRSRRAAAPTGAYTSRARTSTARLPAPVLRQLPDEPRGRARAA